MSQVSKKSIVNENACTYNKILKSSKYRNQWEKVYAWQGYFQFFYAMWYDFEVCMLEFEIDDAIFPQIRSDFKYILSTITFSIDVRLHDFRLG